MINLTLFVRAVFYLKQTDAESGKYLVSGKCNPVYSKKDLDQIFPAI